MTESVGLESVALVSGGSRGIGRAAVLRFVREGVPVAFCYRSNADAARSLEKEAAALGGRATGTGVDVADAEAVRGWVADTEARIGPLGTVVTSAGIVRDGPLVSMSDEDWHRVVDVDLGGVFNVCRAAVFPMLKRRAGCLVNLSSISGVYGNPTQSNYSAAKAGIIGFTRALAKEVGAYGVRANVVAPGLVETDMTAGLAGKVRERALASIPLRRLGTADEVADAIWYLAGARYVTGAVLQVDGGIVL
ncbi:3-oxoacyl-ACP reductase FabG [Actinomadura terrae]|uniref:3-oxoacyl-ACP reductase FabG n=1 Tax=Actinomadura terrae TaxID=604353 RepID=UPI001FA73DD2|nr:3-oxoacyl-ACP reductase FabG [Actinomadura terrae]